MSSTLKSDLHLDFCSHEAAKFAVMRWHYSRAMPAGKLVKIGAWEDGKFIGAVIFGRGANRHIGGPFGLYQDQVCELVRVALGSHQSPTSRVVAVSLKMVSREFPRLALIVSYADTTQGHAGTIYQASNWLYLGAEEYHAYRVMGKTVHP